MRRVLYWMVMQLVLLSAAQAQVSNSQESTFTIGDTGLRHVFEYPLPPQSVVLEFSQGECQTSVTEEYIIPDVPANPGNVALTMLFNAVCDLGRSTGDTVPVSHGGAKRNHPGISTQPWQVTNVGQVRQIVIKCE